jgi:anaerobic selenocysteine-containing dehydrogenase
MAESDCVVIWGTNAVQHPGQCHDPCHARPSNERGAKIVVIDIYRNSHHGTGRPMGNGCMRPGTDGALALVAVMHVLLRDGLADTNIYVFEVHRLLTGL